MNNFQVTSTVPTIYMNRMGQPVNGYVVYFYLVEFDETHSLRVPNLDAKTVETEINKVIDQRKALAQLGKAK